MYQPASFFDGAAIRKLPVALPPTASTGVGEKELVPLNLHSNVTLAPAGNPVATQEGYRSTPGLATGVELK